MLFFFPADLFFLADKTGRCGQRDFLAWKNAKICRVGEKHFWSSIFLIGKTWNPSTIKRLEEGGLFFLYPLYGAAFPSTRSGYDQTRTSFLNVSNYPEHTLVWRTFFLIGCSYKPTWKKGKTDPAGVPIVPKNWNFSFYPRKKFLPLSFYLNVVANS